MIKQRTFYYFPVTLVLLMISTLSFAQVELKTTLSKNKILIGEQISLKVKASFKQGDYFIQFPVLADTFNGFEVLNKSKIDTDQTKSQYSLSQEWQLTHFDSGAWMIPRFPFAIKSLKGEEPQTLYSDSMSVQVQTVAVDTSKPFKPIFGIREASMPLERILMYVGIALLAVILLILMIRYFYKRYSKNKLASQTKKPEIKLPAHEKAYRDLDELESKGLWQQGLEKEYHTALSDIIRTYLEEQFEIDCFEKTSSEIISQVKKIKALSTSRQLLRGLFETADIVKFAKGKPSAEEHIQSLLAAREVVRESTKKLATVNSDQPTERQ